MGNWSKLNANLKALVIQFAILNGVSNIQDIRDTYNLYSSDSNHKYEGNIESTLNLSIVGKDRLQDIAYRIMSLGPAESRSIEDIIREVKLSYTDAPYELNYMGTNMYGAGLGDADPDPNRDSNYMFLYGNGKGHYTPITKEEYRGHSYAPFIKEHYPNKKVYNYRGLFIPLEKVELPTYTKPLVEFLSKNDLGTYNAVLDPKNEEEFNRLISSNYTVDDVGSFRTGVGVSPKGNHEFQLSDIIDFGGGYSTKWGLKAGIQGALLNAVGNPFMLRLYIPIEYTDNPEKINESGIGTLLKMALDNNVASVENDGTLHMMGSPFEIEVTPKNTIVKNASGEIFNKNLYQEEQLVDMLNREWLLKAINPMYSNGGNLVHKYDGNTEETLHIETSFIPTKELYITQQLDSIRNNALERSRNKTQDETTIITEADVYGRKALINRLQDEYNSVASVFNKFLEDGYNIYKKNNPIVSKKYTILDFIENSEEFKHHYEVLKDAKNLLEDAKNGKYKGIELSNCIANLSEMFPHGLPYGNQYFKSNPKKYGFSLIDALDVEPGDLIQSTFRGVPHHAMIYNGIDEKGTPTFNYSNGNAPYIRDGKWYGGYGANKHHPQAVSEDDKHLSNVDVYRYTGTPQDSIQWSNEWELQYGTLQAFGGPLTHKKSTGGPLYPFSFEKNPFLKTPVVRYDEGGKKLDASNPGGYTDELLNKNYLIWNTYDPTGGLDFINYVLSLNFGNMARGEENEYWKEYLGLLSAVPHMNSNANTEWDKKIEQEKIANGELASDFYGTTPRMDYNILALADTLMLGEMVRNYEKYNLEYNLPHIESLTKAYDLAKTILNNPNKWTQVNGEIEVSNWPFNSDISESNPLGMLAKFGMKWVPEENALYMHDTYDFPNRVHKYTSIPVRPREMKIRSKINFDPTKGSWLLRSPVNYSTEIPVKITK